MNLVDTLISQLDDGLRNVFAPAVAARPLPQAASASEDALEDSEKRLSIGLMRVNHVGEVCAQALYAGQYAVARDPSIREVLKHAASEERDHLAWCAARVEALGGRTSVLSPLFYAGAWSMGVVSGLAGDRWSMGFLVETEKQVEAHLDGHLRSLPSADHASRAIVEQMRADEIEHGNTGKAHGAIDLPLPIRSAMTAASKVMTSTTYWV
jgi:ubiquinone biosynthesis monooxygenase Coq7